MSNNEIMQADQHSDTKIMKVCNWITDKAVEGFGPYSGAEELALTYLNDNSYKSNEDRIDALINWETAKNFSSGFVTGLGGFATLPIAIPASLGASWLVQARLAAAIARINGYDIRDSRVKTMILCVIIGQDIKEICKQAGIKVAHRFTYVAIKKLPVEILKKINQAVGFRLVTKAGEKGIVNLTKLVPFVGGVVGGTVDAITCRITAKAAKTMFVALENNQDEELESIDITPLEEPQTVSEIKCENCGLGLSKNSKFCQFCGEKHIPKQQLVINCPKCGKNVSNSKFCSECGYKLEQPVCSKCGTKLTNNEKFCPECGQKSN